MSGIVWDERGDAGERVLCAKLGAYSARLVEGRVWRWQVIDDVEDARDLKVCEMGRCDTLEDARERAEAALRRVAGGAA